ncbi:hypothetical protein [Xanthomonas pisi]|uniref:Uncharacterized protein n=1 Tax=Xanthomonas pisi TaxID=56457 RepID=A0A2S7D143_9XANT|nr:hypothetical protein [Xanthomonas pisi]KLD69624.1 hypothetical protein Y887_16080 [Xanthomonas pisi DSM 18956]PPU67520.1 hypothetical protein XpiCFBP4643_14870 [Xanthomonas pisi]
MGRIKRIIRRNFHCAYKRPGSGSMFIRDRYGRCETYTYVGQRLKKHGIGVTKLAPVYGRVNFSNGVRFTGRVRSLRVLTAAMQSAIVHLRSNWVLLPDAIQYSRRITNQGMSPCMRRVTGAAISATQYAGWVKNRFPNSPLDAAKRYEWCHLLAHSMGGSDDETNIVAAVRGNNTEQLAIESALQMYRRENVFEMRVSAALIDGIGAQHVANVICYEVRCIYGGDNYIRYMDCLNAPNPSQIHFYGVLSDFAMWANQKLQRIADAYNPLTRTIRRELIEMLPDEDE